MDEEDRFTRITLRIPKDLHDKLSKAADAGARSTNAEIIGRLAQTFHEAGSSVVPELEAEIAAFNSRAEALGTRAEVLRLRIDQTKMRLSLLTEQYARMLKEAQSDEDFQKAKEKADEVRAVEVELPALRAEAEGLMHDRAMYLARSEQLERLLADTQAAMEEAMSRFEARRKKSIAQDIASGAMEKGKGPPLVEQTPAPRPKRRMKIGKK